MTANANARNRYRYNNLPDGHIRLLHLVRMSPTNITWELESVRLRSRWCPEFTALSYSWDDQAQYRPFLIGEQVLFITPNAESFLKRVEWCRSPRNMTDREDEGRRFLEMAGRFWIDSICINQDDKIEKACQISMMRELYEEASSIAIWLGEPRRNSKEAFEYVKWRHKDPHGRKSSQIDVGSGQKGLIELLQRPYWRRSWVLQEISTPIEHKVVLCGDLHAPLESFLGLIPSGSEGVTTPMPHRRAVLRALGRAVHLDLEIPFLDDAIDQYLGPPKADTDERRRFQKGYESHGITPQYRKCAESTRRRFNFDMMAYWQDLYDINATGESSSLVPHSPTPSDQHILGEASKELLVPIQTITKKRMKSGEVDLRTLFPYIKEQLASDARDKIFAPLQLTKHATLYPPTYEKPAWVVYCQFASYFIQNTASLQLLNYAIQSESPLHVLPSWVPDWTRTNVSSANPLPNRELPWSKPPRFAIPDEVSRALDGSIGHFSRALTPDEFQRLKPTDKPRLRVCGVRIGTIEVEDPKDKSYTFTHPFQDLKPYWQGRQFVRLKTYKSMDAYGLKRLGIWELDRCLHVLAPEHAVSGDEVYFIFGAVYPVILRRVRHLPKIPWMLHPDGLKEYTFRGEAICRYHNSLHGSLSGGSGVWEERWNLLEGRLTLLPWGKRKQDYRRALSSTERLSSLHDISTEVCEIAIV